MLTLPLLLVTALAASNAKPAELTVLAASSLKQPLESAFAEFEKAHPGVQIHLSAAATGVIAQQLEQGAPADVFIGAAEEPAASYAVKGVLETPVLLARNHLVLAVPAKGSLHPASAADLKGPSYHHIGIGSPKTVPAGKYAMEALQKLNLDVVLADRLVYGQSVAQVLTFLEQGAVEAGFVYASDVAGSGGTVTVATPIDDALHDPIVYPAAVVKKSEQAALARELVAFLQGPTGQHLLVQAGFAPPDTAGIDVAGALPKPGRISQSELEALGPVKAKWTDHQGEHEVLGVPLDRVLTHFGFDPGPMGKDAPKAEKRSGYKKVVVASAPDGFQAVFSCAELAEGMGGTRALVVWQLDGHPLAAGQGPYRLAVLTDKEPSRSLYQLDRIDVIDMRQVVPPRVK